MRGRHQLPIAADILEITRSAELHEARLQDAQGSQPRARERLVIRQDRRHIADVINVNAHVGPRAAELEDLREPKIDLVHSIAIQRARLDQVHGDGVPRDAGERPVESDGVRARRGPVRRQLAALVASERAGHLHVNLRDEIRAEAGDARDESSGRIAPRVYSTLYESEPLFHEKIVARLADTHPLASRKSLKLSDLATVPLVMYDLCLGPGVYDKTLALFEVARLRPRVLNDEPSPCPQSAMMLVASREGYYVSIASPFTEAPRASGVAVIPIDEPNAQLDVRISWRKGDMSRTVREFVRSAQEVFRTTEHTHQVAAR